jgi:hypothetical protein
MIRLGNSHAAPFFRSGFADMAVLTLESGDERVVMTCPSSPDSMEESLAIKYRGTRPTALIKFDDLESVVPDVCYLTINDIKQRIIGVENHGYGVATLVLSAD